MRSVIRDYGARFGGNPFGNNREITAMLNGGNPQQVVFLKPEDGMRLNSRGELMTTGEHRSSSTSSPRPKWKSAPPDLTGECGRQMI